MRRLLIVLLTLGLIFLVSAMLVSLLGAVHPLFDSIAHFRFHLLFLLLCGILVLLLLRNWQRALIFTGILILGVFSLQPALPQMSSSATAGTPYKLVQFNSLFSNPTPDRSLQWIIAQKPDFVMLQEVSSRTVAIYDGLATDLPFGILCKFATVGGVAVRSKFPIKSSDCGNGRGFAWAQVGVGGKSLTLASLHLHWPYPYGQWQHLAKLEADFRNMPRPVALSGDFNAAPWSAAVKRVVNATDTEVAPGLRFTLKMGAKFMKPVPFLPIDHVLLPPDTALKNIAVGPSIGSDHLPIVVEFVLR